MDKKRILSLLMALVILLGTITPTVSRAQDVDKGDVAGDWPMPVEGTYDLRGHLKKMHIQYDGAGEKTLEFSLQFQSTVSPPGINHVDFRVDPRIKEYVTKVEGKGKGALNLGEAYVGFKNRNAAPGAHNKNVHRAKLDGINGLFTALPWGAQVYEAKIIVHLNKKVSELKALFPDRNYTFETRAVGTQGGNIDGEIIKIDKNSLNSATFARFEDQVLTEDNSRWLRSNSTALVEYESGGTLTTNKNNARSGSDREKLPFGQGVMRIKYYIYPHMMIWDSYTALIDQYKHYSFALNIDPKLKELIPAGAEIRVNALRLYGGAYNHVQLPVSYINEENQLRVSIYGTENLNNEDKNTNQVTDPRVTNQNMYISVDADGSLPTYLQIEIPIDETKAENNFDYNQYNFQGFYYNRRGQLVKNSLVRTFTNAAKTDQMPGISAEGKARLWGDEVKGNSEYPGSQVYLVSNPDLDAQGNGVPGTGKVIGQMTTSEKNFIIKTFEKDGQAHNPNNPNLFKDIINPATGSPYKAGEKVYVFQAKPGRMMSKGVPVTLIEDQTNKPEIDPVFAKELIQGALGVEKYFKVVSGSVEKINPESPVDVKIIWHGEGAKLINAGTDQESVSGGKQKATYTAQRVPKGETVEQTGGKPHFIVNFDGTFSYMEDVGAKLPSTAKKAFQIGDIIEVVATEEHCKESVHTYYVITEEGAEAKSRKPQVGIIYPTLPDASKPSKQIDSNFNKPNRDGDKSFVIEVQGGAIYRVEYYIAGSETPQVVEAGTSVIGKDPNDWYPVYPQLPESGLQPGDIVKVYQRKWIVGGHAPESLATERVVQQHPDEYFGYTIEVYLEGKEGPQETIYVHKDGQIYPNEEGVGAAILNYIQANAPELPFPTRLKDELMRPERVAHNYIYNNEKSTKFPITVTRDYKAFWDNLGKTLEEANKASFAQNVFELHFDRDPGKWADLIVEAGANGHFTKASLAADDTNADVYMVEDVDGKIANLTVKGIELDVVDENSPTNAQGEKQPRNLTWAEIKAKKDIPGVNVEPIANPGYKFAKYIDVDSKADFVLEDVTEIDRSTNIVAQYDVDTSQEFGYEVQYVYNKGTDDAPEYEAVPDKEAVKGQAPVETVVQINQDPVDGFQVAADQPTEFTVEYVEENGQNNKVEGNVEPGIRQVVKVVYEVAESQKPTIDNEVIYDTTEEIFGTAAPYAGIKLYALKDGEEYNPETSRKLAEVMTDKDGNYKGKVENLVVGDRIIAVAKDPLKGEKLSDEKIVQDDTNKYTGTIAVNPIPKNGGEVVSGTITIDDNPNKPGEPKPELNGVVVEVYKVDETAGTETLIGKTVADENGVFHTAVSPKLEAGEKLVAKAKPKKTNLLESTAIVVAVNPERLNKAIADGEEFLGREDIGNFDAGKVKELQDAIKAGKALVDAEGNPIAGKTQKDVDDAAKKIEDALKALNVNTAPFIDASDKVLDVGDEFDPLAGVTVKDAQQTDLEATVKSSTVPVRSDTDNTTTTVGTYKVIYTVTDSGKLTTEKEITVTVRENDKAELKVAINKGENVLADGKQYDPTQVKALKDAIAAGKVVDANPNATKTEIQEAKDAINTALTAITGNVQASVAPAIDKVRDGDVLVKGKLLDAENNPIANAEITITDKATGKVLGIAKTDATGAYSVSVPALKDTQVIQAVAREEGKNPSEVVEATVVPNTDKLAETIEEADDYVANNPLVPGDPVDDALDAALKEAKEVKDKAEQEPPTATQDQVDQAQKDLEDALNAKKEKDTAETNVPKINELKNGEAAVAGTATPGSTVTVTMPDGATYTGKADATNGEYNIPTRTLVGGEVVKVTATVDGVESNPAEATVVTDVAKLKDAIAKGETAAEGLDPNTTDPEDKELLDAIAAGKDILVDPTDPNSAAKPGKTQKEADDAADRILAAIKAKQEADENDANAIQTPKPTVDPVSNGATTVKGTAEPGATVTVYLPNGTIAKATATEEGTFEVKTGTLKGGDVINVTAKLPKRPESEKVEVTVDAKVAETPVINDIAHLDTVVKGTAKTATEGDEVVVTIDDKISVKTTVKADGTWEVTVPAALQSGQVVKAVLVPADKTIDKSEPAEKVVGLNTTGLQESYDKADPIVNNPDKPLDRESNTDKELQEAFDKAKDVLDNANSDNPTVTQEEIDQAKKELDDALAAKEKFEEAKTAVDEAKANPSEETIANAQEKIDAMDGSIDPTAPDYNKDKADLQKELDKIKLQEAKEKAEEKLDDPNLDPKDKEEIEKALDEVNKDLEALNDPDKEDPSHDKINEDIKNLEDAINGAKNQTKLDPLAPVKTGAQQVKGTSEEGAVVKIFVDGVEVGTTTAGADGAFTYNHDKPLNAGQVVKAIAKVEGKTDSLPQEVTVGIDISGLQDAIEKGETALTERNDGKNADKELQEAIDAGKALITPEGTPVEGKTQEDVDKAEKDIRDALDKKEKTDAAEDKVKALEDKQAGDQTLPENKISPEEIVEAQQAIDAIPGSIEDPNAEDFNQDKKDLQDRLDRVKAMEDLKDVVEKGKEEKDKAIADGKPQDVIDELEKVIKDGETIIGNNGEGKTTVEIQEVVKEIERVIEKINKKSILASIENASIGRDIVQITTNPGNANLEFKLVKANGTILEFNKTTTATGVSEIILEKPLEQFDMIFITATKDGYLKFTKSILVN